MKKITRAEFIKHITTNDSLLSGVYRNTTLEELQEEIKVHNILLGAGVENYSRISTVNGYNMKSAETKGEKAPFISHLDLRDTSIYKYQDFLIIVEFEGEKHEHKIVYAISDSKKLSFEQIENEINLNLQKIEDEKQKQIEDEKQKNLEEFYLYMSNSIWNMDKIKKLTPIQIGKLKKTLLVQGRKNHLENMVILKKEVMEKEFNHKYYDSLEDKWSGYRESDEQKKYKENLKGKKIYSIFSGENTYFEFPKIIFDLIVIPVNLEESRAVGSKLVQPKFKKQCKATSIDKLGTTFKEEPYYYSSKKYDGEYCQIIKEGNNVKCFNSNGKEIILDAEIISQVLKIPYSKIHLECEFIGDTQGNLGDRDNAKLAKSHSKSKLVIFDIVNDDQFEKRLILLNTLSNTRLDNFHIVEYERTTLNKALTKKIEQSIEGLVLKSPTHTQNAGERVKNSIKIKPLLTEDFKVTEFLSNNFISIVDSSGIVGKVKVDRHIAAMLSFDSIIECVYERFKNSYIQLRFKDIRFDKVEA